MKLIRESFQEMAANKSLSLGVSSEQIAIDSVA